MSNDLIWSRKVKDICSTVRLSRHALRISKTDLQYIALFYLCCRNANHVYNKLYSRNINTHCFGLQRCCFLYTSNNVQNYIELPAQMLLWKRGVLSLALGLQQSRWPLVGRGCVVTAPKQRDRTNFRSVEWAARNCFSLHRHRSEKKQNKKRIVPKTLFEY